jgi:adenylosuccinate synthase
VIKSVHGSIESISNAKSFEELPINEQKYGRVIEEVAGVSVKWIGVGPKR